MLVHGIEESIKEVWVTKQSTLEKFDQFLENGLKICRSQIKVTDIHRLPQRPLFKQGHQVCRPIIVKLSSVFNKQLILSLCKNLKAYNANLFHDGKLTNGKQGRTIYVTEHLPKTFVNQKKLLLPSFNKARKEKKNKPTGELIKDNIVYSWITKKSRHQLHLDVLTVGTVLYVCKRVGVQFSVGKRMSNSNVNTIRTRLLFNYYLHRCCIVTSVSVNVNLLWLQ